MKIKILLALALLAPVLLFAQSYKRHLWQKGTLTIQLTEGKLLISPLSDKATRVQWRKDLQPEQQEFVLVNAEPLPAVRFTESAQLLTLQTSAVTIHFHKESGIIRFADKAGKLFLSEKAGGRKLTTNTLAEDSCYIAEQTFESPEDELLLGLGQFQDGQFNLRNVSRKLIQVNSQIAIPFLYSSKGYGLLWHQYGITEFNPADNLVNLIKKDSTAGDKTDIEVTTTSGTQRVSRQQAMYHGSFTVDKDGDYTMMLDMGNMESRHLLVIDGVPCIDQSNQWLPPAAGTVVPLKAGTHTVQIICKASNTPRLTWKKAGNETVFRSAHARSLDYVVFHGKDADDIIASYRKLSGKVPLLPLWAYGFWQCRERYTSGNHLVQTIEEFRKRNLPVDVIVQDWQYWGKYGWGVPKFDETQYPEPGKFIQQLHNMGARFSISVWENLDKKSEVAKDYTDKNLYIPNSPWIDIYNPETQKTHWNALNKNLFTYGVDSWWMDATEPENDALAGKPTYLGPGNFYRLTYPLFVSKAVYDGQRNTNDQKRVAILTRSAFAGQQRYGTINWSGDIGWNWDTYKRQIVAGLNYNMTGMPYWTTDIGGFFRPGKSQYTDAAYHDLLTRWFQWGAFCPIFRIHGYQTETEPWKYGDAVESRMRSMLNLRYRLLPYIYSTAWQVSGKGSTMMRPLVMDFSNDTAAVGQAYQYMFGNALLVAPVTEPGVQDMNVYLPKAAGWYNFWSGQCFNGGKTIKTTTPQDQLPLFVKAGSILPMGKLMQYTSEKKADTLEIRVYPGADGEFSLYQDEGDNYGYERGAYTIIPFKWIHKQQTLYIGKRKGSYTGMLRKQVFQIVFVNEASGHGGEITTGKSKTVVYTGEGIEVR